VRGLREGDRYCPLWIHAGVSPARVRSDHESVAFAVALYAARYRQPRPNPNRVVLEITVERVLGSAGMRVSDG
jgi:F420H(2)-dependent biliverdin reductase